MNALQSLVHERLTAHFSPSVLEITDESHLHAGHTGAVGGGQHFALTLHSAQFEIGRASCRERVLMPV